MQNLQNTFAFLVFLSSLVSIKENTAITLSFLNIYTSLLKHRKEENKLHAEPSVSRLKIPQSASLSAKHGAFPCPGWSDINSIEKLSEPTVYSILLGNLVIKYIFKV